MHGEGRDDNAARRNEAAARKDAAIGNKCRGRSGVGEALRHHGYKFMTMT